MKILLKWIWNNYSNFSIHNSKIRNEFEDELGDESENKFGRK